MNKIKKGDTVVVIAGKDKGKDGKVLSVKDGKVLVEGIGMVTKHMKPSAANQQGGIVNKESPISTCPTLCICTRANRPESVLSWTAIRKSALRRRRAT